MILSNFILRRRVAHHEAAHAVMAVATGFPHRETFLTRGTRLDGRIGGWTSWSNPLNPVLNPSPQAFGQYAALVVMVLFAGQYAEQELSSRCPLVRLPKHEPNWDHDNAEAARILAVPPLSGVADAERSLRDAAKIEVGRLWWVVRRVAMLLLKPSDGAPSITSSHSPSGQIVRHGDIHALLQEWLAEGQPELPRPAWRRWREWPRAWATCRGKD